MSNEMANYMKKLGSKITMEVVQKLSTKYKFSYEEALKDMRIDVKETAKGEKRR